MKNDVFVTVVLVAEPRLGSIGNHMREIGQDLQARFSDYEMLVVAQGPAIARGAVDWDELLLDEVPGIRFIQLTSYVSKDVAWAAGLENAIGDYVVMFDPLRDPLSAVSGTVALCQTAADIVVGIASQRHTWPYIILRHLSEYVLRAAGYALPRNATTLRCLSRRTVNAVTRTGRFHHQLFMRIHKTGYPQTTYQYHQHDGGSEIHSLASGVRRFVHILVFNSSAPLRWMSALGLCGSVVALLFAAYSILAHFISGTVVEGWTTTILFMSMLFLIQFVMMAFFGEYLGRLLDDRSEQADYAVAFEQTSRCMVNQDRVNVLGDSLDA